MIHTDDVCSLGSGNDIPFHVRTSKGIGMHSIANVNTGSGAVEEYRGGRKTLRMYRLGSRSRPEGQSTG